MFCSVKQRRWCIAWHRCGRSGFESCLAQEYWSQLNILPTTSISYYSRPRLKQKFKTLLTAFSVSDLFNQLWPSDLYVRAWLRTSCRNVYSGNSLSILWHGREIEEKGEVFHCVTDRWRAHGKFGIFLPCSGGATDSVYSVSSGFSKSYTCTINLGCL